MVQNSATREQGAASVGGAQPRGTRPIGVAGLSIQHAGMTATIKCSLLLAVALAGFSTVPAQTSRSRRPQPPQRILSARQIAQRTILSVVLLVTTDEDGNPIALGSGFFVASDRIATNYHVIKDASKVFAKIAGRRKLYEIPFIGFPDEQSDLVLLRIDEIKGQSLKLGNLAALHVGDDVYVMGNPEGLEGTFSKGNVSAIRSAKGLIQITAPISHGSSGGPVLDERGEVIGIAAGILSEGQNLNFAISVSKLAPLLRPENDLLAGMIPDSAPPSSSGPKKPLTEWQLVNSSDTLGFYISRSRITATPEHTLLAWLKSVPNDSPKGREWLSSTIKALVFDKADRSYLLSYSMEQYEFDCGHQKTRRLGWGCYDKDGGVLFFRNLLQAQPPEEWETVLPNTVSEGWLNFVCKEDQ